MANQISIIITAQDEASKKLAGLSGALDQTSNAAEHSTTTLQKVQNSWYAFAGIAAATGVGLRSLTNEMGSDVEAAVTLQSALTGLSSVARANGQDIDAAKRAAQALAKDGLMTVAQSATGLKNLLASGFSLDQAVTLMNRFKDSAAFGRQASLSFGDAVATATEGIKNGNSILVDNAGVTKNLSIMLEEAGFSAQDLMRATSDGSVRQAIYNGILKETNAQSGDAARLTAQYAGKQAEASAQATILKQQIGTALQPALVSLLSVVTPMIVAVADWTSKHQNLAAAILIGTTVVLGTVAALAAFGAAVATITPALPVLAAVATGSFGAIAAGAGGAQAAVASLAAFVGGPAALGVWGVFAAAAIGAFVLIQNKAGETNGVLDETLRRIQGVQKGDEAAIKVLQGKANDARARGDQATANKYAQQIRTIYGSVPGYASGTSFAPGGAALVGERGPELVNLPRGSQVIPNEELGRQPGPGASSFNITFNIGGNVVGNEGALRGLAVQMAQMVEQAVRGQGASSVAQLRATS